MKHLVVMMAFWAMLIPYELKNSNYISRVANGSKNYFNLDNTSLIRYSIKTNYGIEAESYDVKIKGDKFLFMDKNDIAIIKNYLNNN